MPYYPKSEGMLSQHTSALPDNFQIWDLSALPLSLAVLIPGTWIVITLVTGKARLWVPLMAPFVADRRSHPRYYWGSIGWFSFMFLFAAAFGIWLRMGT